MEIILDPHGLGPSPNICIFPEPPSFSFPTTFKGVMFSLSWYLTLVVNNRWCKNKGIFKVSNLR